MKTTLDLPDTLIKQVKLRALKEGKKLKDAVADLLRKGLAVAASENTRAAKSPLSIDKKTGLPRIECRHAASAQDELTADRVAEILLAQEVEWQHAGG
jgi:plasmid stability protein